MCISLVECLLVSLNKKRGERVLFFKPGCAGSAQRCHRLGSEKLYFSGKMVGFQLNSDKNDVIRGKNTNWRPLLNSNEEF